MKLRIMRRWHKQAEHGVFSVQKKVLGLFWVEVDWFSNLNTATEMVECYNQKEVTLLT